VSAIWNWASEVDDRSTVVKDNPRVSGILDDPVHPAELQEDPQNWPTEPRKSRRKSEGGRRRKSEKKPRKTTDESKEPSHAPEFTAHTLTRHTTGEMHEDVPAEIESKVRRRRKRHTAKDGLESESRSRHKEHLSREEKREHQKHAEEILDPNYEGVPMGRPQKREGRKTEDRHRRRSPRRKTRDGENRERRPVRTEGGERRPRKSEGGEKRRRKSAHAKERKSHH